MGRGSVGYGVGTKRRMSTRGEGKKARAKAGQAGGGRAGVGRRDGHLPIIFQNRIFATAAAAAAAAAPGGKT